MAGFTSPTTTRFIDVKPGSIIEVTDYDSRYQSFEATVLSMDPEFGPQRIPMLKVKVDHADDPILLMADGQTRVKVLTDSGILASQVRSDKSLHLRAIPREVWALQFDGGVESATVLIRAASGKVALQYVVGTDQSPEHLFLNVSGGGSRIGIHDFLVEDADTGVMFAISSTELEARYEALVK
jgi:hypothetical protein